MRRPSVGILGVIVLIGTTLVLTGPLESSATASCAAVQFVGVRGSGEAPGFGAPVGAELTAYRSDKGQNESIGSYAIVYPATTIPIITGTTPAAFAQSVNAGVGALQNHLASESAACPNQQFVVSGYSQGALVVDVALAHEPPGILARVKGVTLFGDPLFKPGQPYDAGTYSNAHEGLVSDLLPWIANGDALPASLDNSSRSYCIGGDPICNYSFLNLFNCWRNLSTNTCAHQLYAVDGYSNQAAAFLARES